MLSLGEVASLLGAEVDRADVRLESLVAAVTHDSRQVTEDTVFACIPGENVDGHDFAIAAQNQGAVGLLVERLLPVEVPQLVVADVRSVLGEVAAAIYGQPSESLQVIGVTGTAGKTTVVHLLEAALGHLGVSARSIGTLTGARTTPEAPELQRQLRDFVDADVAVAALEVSSHALELGRVAGTRFDVSLFTNLGHDHLDFHGTVEAYEQAKAKLFSSTYAACAVVNRDDAAGRRLLDSIAGAGDVDARSYGASDASGLRGEGMRNYFEWRGCAVVLQLAGDHNVLNALGVATALEALGHSAVSIAAALCSVTAPAGRFEVVDSSAPFEIVIDYAHKPEALAATLRTARSIVDRDQNSGRVILVFGCGGDRDTLKRPMMGKVAGGADLVIVTSDNPRTEDPATIADEVVNGVPQGTQLRIELDRSAAILLAVKEARDGDVVLIAGKGHEQYQEVNGIRNEFNDRVVAIGHVGRPQ